MSKIDLSLCIDEEGIICKPYESSVLINIWHTYGKFFDFNEEIQYPASLLKDINKLLTGKKNGSDGRNQYFITYIEDYEDDILERTYCVRIKKSKIESKLLADAYGPEFAKDNATIKWAIDVKEVYRRTKKMRWQINSLKFCGMAGWRVDWPDMHKADNYTRCSGYYYWGSTCDDTVSVVTNEKYEPGMWRCIGPSTKDYQKLKNVPPHFVIDKECFAKGFDIFKYIKAFETYPELEMVVKSGLGYLWKDTKLLAATKAKKKEIISFIKANPQYIRDSHPLFTEMCLAIKGNCKSHEETKKYKKLRRTLSRMKKKFRFDERLGKEIHRYLEKQELLEKRFYISDYLGEYVDYLEMSKAIGRDITDRGVLFPKDFASQMDSLRDLFKKKESREYQEAYERRFAAFAIPDSMVADPGFVIKPIINASELVDLGNHLHNCIGTGKYGEKVLTGKCLLFKIEHEGTPIRCVEISVPGAENESGTGVYKTFNVIQNRGDHNSSAEFDPECRKVANKLVRFLNKNALQRATA